MWGGAVGGQAEPSAKADSTPEPGLGGRTEAGQENRVSAVAEHPSSVRSRIQVWEYRGRACAVAVTAGFAVFLGSVVLISQGVALAQPNLKCV